MSDTYYVGSYAKDGLEGPNRGWIMGTFMDDAPRKNADVEIKYWEFPKGEATGHPMKTSAIIECTLILKGSTRAVIDGQEIVLHQGDYVVISPGTPNNTVAEVLEDCAGLTVKAPSDPSAKKVL